MCNYLFYRKETVSQPAAAAAVAVASSSSLASASAPQPLLHLRGLGSELVHGLRHGVPPHDQHPRDHHGVALELLRGLKLLPRRAAQRVAPQLARRGER